MTRKHQRIWHACSKSPSNKDPLNRNASKQTITEKQQKYLRDSHF
jgi:hypothetical protein